MEIVRVVLERLDLLGKEKRDHEGYVRYPDSLDEPAVWNKVVDWPAE